jgi:drug/metabolite transporter (DMT)-like permease
VADPAPPLKSATTRALTPAATVLAVVLCVSWGFNQVIGDLMLLLAGAAWGATTLVVKATSLARTSSEKVLLYQLVISAPVIAISAGISGERVLAPPSAVATASLLYQAVWWWRLPTSPGSRSYSAFRQAGCRPSHS